MARPSDTLRSDEDEPFSLGRPLIIGTIAGVIACYGFVGSLGYSNDSNSFWRNGPRVVSASTNQPGPSESQATTPEQVTDPDASPTQDQQQAPQSQDPMQNPADDQNDDLQPTP
jgi:hypothetical protein